MGEMITAVAEPAFNMPLAVPANFGAISIGTAQIGPIGNSFFLALFADCLWHDLRQVIKDHEMGFFDH
jgi:hypothetical protein